MNSFARGLSVTQYILEFTGSGTFSTVQAIFKMTPFRAKVSVLYIMTIFGASTILYYHNAETDWSLYLRIKRTIRDTSFKLFHSNANSLQGTPRDWCGCPLRRNDGDEVVFTKENSSHCSAESSLLGNGQKVISFSLFRRKNSKQGAYHYFDGVLQNLENMRIYYPGWVMQLYVHMDPIWDSKLCSIMCSNSDFYLCNIEKLPALGNLSHLYGRVWRFIVLGDPTVDIFVSRDIDGVLGSRERAAVEVWEKSNYTFHAMRDHPSHKARILAGMWGAKNYCLNVSHGKYLRKLMFINVSNEHLTADQHMLAARFYRTIRRDLLVQDSFNCLKYKDSLVIPFPVQRHNFSDFVGNVYYSKTKYIIRKPCPVQCRPSYGQNWTYC